MAGSSFGGTIKLTGENEYRNALKNITSELKSVSSQLKLATTEFTNNGNKVGDLRTVNESLSNKLKQEQEIVKVCANAIKDFTEQQTKNKNKIDELNKSLEDEKQKLDTMKNSTSTSTEEISKQEKVIKSLEDELTKTQNSYDANNRKINEYTTKMNNAKTECSNLSTEIKNNQKNLDKYGDTTEENAKSIEEFSKAEDKASDSSLKLADIIKGNLISEGIISGIKGMANAIKSVGSALIDVGKSAVDSYADYEQLSGGVKTLFKDNAADVEALANVAYKTAGLSANEYMETITSFSSSLLQSLNGDTAMAAEYADNAIIDMADNANKMGTDISMIQSAYQGFAKQNYTMLDNLKLGYGGTKTEMERLIADANKVKEVNGEMADLSIDSFADITEAIGIIQDEMGITGTTMEEAKTSITGSISSMKSAWGNFLTGLVNGNADIGGLVNNLVDSVLTVADNILPAVDQVSSSIINVLPQLLNKIVEYLPRFLETGVGILNNLISGIQQNLPTIMEAVLQIITAITNALIENLPQLMEMGIQLIVSLAQGIGEQLPTLIPQIIDGLISMVDALLDNIDLIIDAGIQLIMGLADGLINALPKLIDRIPEIIDKLITAITNNLPKLIMAGTELTIKLAVGLIQAIPQLISKIPEIIASLVKGFVNYYGQMIGLGGELLGKVKDGISNSISGMLDVGRNIVQGLWNGINNAKDWVLDKIKGFGKSVLDGIKSFFGIHSPSTVFKNEIGTNLALGLGEGFVSEMSNVNKRMTNAIPTDFDIGINTSLNNSSMNNIDNNRQNLQGQNSNQFVVNINNNSKYISPADNAKQMRSQVQWYLLNKGRRTA